MTIRVLFGHFERDVNIRSSGDGHGSFVCAEHITTVSNQNRLKSKRERSFRFNIAGAVCFIIFFLFLFFRVWGLLFVCVDVGLISLTFFFLKRKNRRENISLPNSYYTLKGFLSSSYYSSCVCFLILLTPGKKKRTLGPESLLLLFNPFCCCCFLFFLILLLCFFFFFFLKEFSSFKCEKHVRKLKFEFFFFAIFWGGKETKRTSFFLSFFIY